MKNLLESFHLDVIEVSDESVNGPMGGILQCRTTWLRYFLFVKIWDVNCTKSISW